MPNHSFLFLFQQLYRKSITPKFFFILLSALTFLPAQTVRLTGKVTNCSGDPVSGAAVTLVPYDLTAVTNGEGVYEIMAAAGVGDLITSQNGTHSLSDRELRLTLTSAASVSAVFLDLKGKLIQEANFYFLDDGEHRLVLPKLKETGLYFMMVNIGNTRHTHRVLASPSGSLIIMGQNHTGHTPSHNPPAKKSAAADVLEIRASGLVEQAMPVDSLTGIVNAVMLTEAEFAEGGGDCPLPNMLVNGGFEQGTTGWSGFESPWSLTDIAKSGSQAADNSGGSFQNLYQEVAMKTNTRYQLSAWVRSEPGSSGHLTIDTQDQFDLDVQSVHDDHYGTWTYYIGSFNSGSATSVKIRAFSTDFNGNVQIDNLQLIEGDGSPPGGGGFPHPSVISTREQLEVMKHRVNNLPGSVAKGGWDRMLGTKWAKMSYSHRPYETVHFVASGGSSSESQFRDDAQAARSQALQWVVTGDSKHREKALEIINDWMNTFKGWTSNTIGQPRLECAWALPTWLGAADILRDWDSSATDWSAAEQKKFESFATKCYLEARKAMNKESNWAVTTHQAMLAYALYMDSRELMESALSLALDKLGALSELDGEIVETCRDLHHPQYTLVSWIGAAEAARNAGYPDLYNAIFDGQSIPRLAIILEYFANMFRGITDDPCNWGRDYEGAQNQFDVYEAAYNHYLYNNKVTYMPVFKDMIENHWRDSASEGVRFVLWSRLTHGENNAGY